MIDELKIDRNDKYNLLLSSRTRERTVKRNRSRHSLFPCFHVAHLETLWEILRNSVRETISAGVDGEIVAKSCVVEDWAEIVAIRD